MPERCLIPNCKREGIWKLGVRARLIPGAKSPTHPTKKKTDAVFAPDVPECLCDYHATSGLLITVMVEPRKYKATRVRAVGAPPDHAHRTVKIQ